MTFFQDHFGCLGSGLFRGKFVIYIVTTFKSTTPRPQNIMFYVIPRSVGTREIWLVKFWKRQVLLLLSPTCFTWNRSCKKIVM